jgi:hypothetical protein
MSIQKKSTKADQKESAAKKHVLEVYVEIVKQKNMFPTRMDLQKAGINRDKIRHYFVNISGLRKAAKMAFPESFCGIIEEEDYTNEKSKSKLQKEIKKYKRFVITTAINGQWIHPGFMSSLENFAKLKNAKVLILPAHDPAHNLDNEIEWHFDESITKHTFIFDQVALNANISISSLRINAKQINPTTGLGRICQGDGSFIFASPKQSLEYNPVSNVKYPHAQMTTGACTIPNYSSTKGNSLRTAFIAEHDHIIGALVVEIQDKEVYHFRQLQSDEEGGFCDLGYYYKKNDKPLKVVPKLVMGDYHAGEHDDSAIGAWEEIINELKVDEVILHDLFNGKSINHHEENNIVLRARYAKNGLLDLKNELSVTGQQVNRIFNHKSIKKAIVIKSNHDEFLQRWLEQGKFKYDPINFQVGCQLATLLVDGCNALEQGLAYYGMIKDKEKLVFLDRDQDYKIAGIVLGNHGDKGPNGSHGNKQNLERAYGKCVIGHSHTPGILRGVYQVGTSSLFDLGYNKGPSSWMHCSCLVYPNGHRQLINSINGKWKL